MRDAAFRPEALSVGRLDLNGHGFQVLAFSENSVGREHLGRILLASEDQRPGSRNYEVSGLSVEVDEISTVFAVQNRLDLKRAQQFGLPDLSFFFFRVHGFIKRVGNPRSKSAPRHNAFYDTYDAG